MPHEAPNASHQPSRMAAPPPADEDADAAAEDAAEQPPPSPVGAHPASSPIEDDDLEELTLPSTIQPPPRLPEGTCLGPDDRLTIGPFQATRGRVNTYRATWQDENGESVPVEVREAPLDHPALAREAEILAGVRYAMLPRLHAAFEHDERRYLVLEQIPTESLADALLAETRMDVDHLLSVLLQLVQALRRLHQAGWTLPTLTPADVCLATPIKLPSLASATRLGETLPHPVQVAGYSAPELAHPVAVAGKEAVYTVGAFLFHGLAGRPLPEEGIAALELPALAPLPGAPPLLAAALAPAEERIDLEMLYQRLLALKQRRATRPLGLEIASATTLGLNPGREVNEDACGYLAWSTATASAVRHHALLCVADGMGGMEAGEVASGTVLASVLRGAAEHALDPSTPLNPVALVQRAATAAHAAGEGRQMGTTVTLAVVDDGSLTLAHVGDTRAYHQRAGTLTQITRDHSLVAAMVASGVLTPQEARGHPDSNKVLRSLGSQRTLPDAYVDTLAAAHDHPTLDLQPGDWVLLCTDGIWGSVEDEHLRVTLAEALAPPSAARALVDAALRAGAPDNAAVVVARVVEIPAG